MLNVTVPPAFEVAPVKIAVSVTVLNTVMLENESWVEIDGEAFCIVVTVRISLHGLFDGLLPVSPL
jgi:hypothetical protein